MENSGILRNLWADAREAVVEQFEYRDLLLQLTKRDLLIRYKQAIMGFGWAVFMPLINTVVFSVIFTRVAPIAVDVPYPLFAYLGLLTWNFTASSLRFAVSALTGNISLVTKVYCPREIFIISSILVTLIDTLVGAIVLVGLMLYYGIGPGWALAYLPLVVLVQITFTTAVGLFLSMANLFYRDVKYLFELVISVWMFGTSVLYPSNLLSGAASLALRLNPMTAIIDGYRNVLLYGRTPLSTEFLWTALGAALLLGFTSIVFHRAEFRFAENV